MTMTERRNLTHVEDRADLAAAFRWCARLNMHEAVASAGRVHDRKLASRFPPLAGLEMQYRWAGAMALTWNSVPIVEEVDHGVWMGAGCNGVGATNATANGIVAAERALGHLSQLGRHVEQAPAAKRLPPEPFATIGGKAALKWKEWRAGEE